MTGDYYNALGITRDAENEDIAKAFRKMALKYHPQLSKMDTNKYFMEVAEAYEVLSDPRLRACYNEYGEEGLKQGSTNEESGYRFSGDADEIFKQFFGVANPFQIIGDAAGAKHKFFSQQAGQPRRTQQQPTKEVEVRCSLEEIFSGANRSVTVSDDKGDGPCESAISFDIEKGLPAGSKLRFNRKSEHEGLADVSVTVVQEKHPRFVWRDDDLIYTHRISLEDALCGFSIEVKTLDNRTLSVFINEVVHPQYTKVISGEGMPIYQKRGQRGDLIICFETEFPTYLTEGQKKEITRIFNSNAAKA